MYKYPHLGDVCIIAKITNDCIMWSLCMGYETIMIKIGMPERMCQLQRIKPKESNGSFDYISNQGF